MGAPLGCGNAQMRCAALQENDLKRLWRPSWCVRCRTHTRLDSHRLRSSLCAIAQTLA